MEQECSRLIPMAISALAACFSAYFAFRNYRMQNQLIINKSAIEELNELIEILQEYKAIKDFPDRFSDDEFMRIFDSNLVKNKIIRLHQHENIASKIKIEEWNSPILELDLKQKISSLHQLRKALF